MTNCSCKESKDNQGLLKSRLGNTSLRFLVFPSFSAGLFSLMVWSKVSVDFSYSNTKRPTNQMLNRMELMPIEPVRYTKNVFCCRKSRTKAIGLNA